MILFQASVLAGLASTAIAHSHAAPEGESSPSPPFRFPFPPATVNPRLHLTGYRHINLMHRRDLEKRCGVQLAQQKLKRRTYKRDLGLVERSSTSSNDSYCSMTPEVTQGTLHDVFRQHSELTRLPSGPYHILGELVRQNITENQAGVPLEVRINIIDIASCSPVQMWVDAWHANATGFYSDEFHCPAVPLPGAGLPVSVSTLHRRDRLRPLGRLFHRQLDYGRRHGLQFDHDWRGQLNQLRRRQLDHERWRYGRILVVFYQHLGLHCHL